MQDQPVPSNADAQFAAWKQGIEERIRALETAPRITTTSQRGGSYQLLDDQGRKLFTFGEYTRGAFTDYGIQARVPDGAGPGTTTTALEINVNGMEAPQIPLTISKSGDIVVVTSGTFTSVWAAWAALLISDTIVWRSIVGCDAGTTAEVRLESGGSFTGVITCAAGGFTNINYNWLHGKNQGGSLGMTLQVRRTGGTGNVNVYTPYYAAQAGSAGTSSTATGL